MQPIPVTVPSDANSLPSELFETPQPVIGFTGLDCSKNLDHKSIWDAFNNNRKADRAAIQFKLLPPNYEFPVVKPKRQSYEWYHPKGILKRNWILKHLHVLPAVIVLFQDLEWNDPQWTEKQYQCVSMMQTLKTMIQGRNTKLAIVLLQRNTTASGNDDDRLSTLAAKCEINQKMIFALPFNDHLTGYTLRLESAFLEQAQTYYTQLSKQVRMHRDQLTSTHQDLKIRHQFKLGFFSEMRQDLNTALKHYGQAYEWLEEIRIVDTNCLEIKVVAGIINFKVCKLMFNVGSPRDAITQFRTHIDKYRNRVGFKELQFEHFAWLSVQYNAFAELFCDAIKCGLPALQTQHPGIYYHKAAEYMNKRKEAFQQLQHVSSPLIDFMPITEQNVVNYSNILYSDFFGGRGSNRTTELVNDQQIIAIVQECEKCINHSAAFITLLGQAMAQFKIYRCLRFRKKLAIDMAEEYLKTGDASKALTLYSLMLADYRVEKWDNVFTQVLLKTLRSAFLSASVPDFVACSLESLSMKIQMEHTDRILILENLWKIFQKVPPMPQSQIVPELRNSWEVSLQTFNTKLTFDLDKITKLFESVVKFEKTQLNHDEKVRLNLLVRSLTDIPLKIHEFAVVISDSKALYKLNACEWIEVKNIIKANEYTADNRINTEFMMEPNTLYRISFVAEQYQFSENSELQINRLEMKMGLENNFITLVQSSTLNHSNDFKSYNRKISCLDILCGGATCYIVPIFHLVVETLLSHKSMLTNEYFKMTTRVDNDHDIVLEDVSVGITIPAHLRNKVFIVADLAKSKQKILSQYNIDIGNLPPKDGKKITFNVLSLMEGTIELSKSVRYQITNTTNVTAAERCEPLPTNDGSTITAQPVSQPSRKSHSINIEYVDGMVVKSKKETIVIPCTAEFLFTGKLYTLSKEPLQKAYKNEDFLYRVELEIKSVDIEILDMFLISDYNITEKPYGTQRQQYGQTYSKGEKVCDVRLLHAEETTNDWITRADYQQRKLNKNLFGHVKQPSQIIHSTEINAQLVNLNKSGEDNFRSNLLSKIPINSTIVDTLTSPSAQAMNRSITDDLKISSNLLAISSNDLTGTQDNQNTMVNDVPMQGPKTIYNNAIDAFTMIDKRKGFLLTNSINTASNSSKTSSGQNSAIIGIYCVRWRRNGELAENETKLIVNCVEIVEAPLNIYCYLDEKMYVKVPMTLTITLKNSSNAIIHLKTFLKNSDNFMFAGHTQLNVSLFARSSYNLQFNLYPLKAGWQQLPEFEIKYNTPEDVVQEKRAEEHANNLELQKLVQRWMPKKVFILPMVRQT